MGYLCKVRFRRVTNAQKVTMNIRQNMYKPRPTLLLKGTAYLKYKYPKKDHKRDFKVLIILKGKTELKHAALTQGLSGK